MTKTKNPELERRRRAQIIETVGRLLAEGPHRSLTLEKVAREMGASKGMVTYYFKSKDRLIAAAIAHYLDELQETIGDLIRSDLPMEQRLKSIVDLALASRDVLEWRFRFQVEAWSFIKDAPEVLEAVRESYLHFRHECMAILEEGLAEEHGRSPTADAEWLYLFLQSLLDGLALNVALDPKIELAEVRARTFELLRMLLGASPGN